MDTYKKYLIEAKEHSLLKKTLRDVIKNLEKATHDYGEKAEIRGIENQASKLLDGIVKLSNKLKVKI